MANLVLVVVQGVLPLLSLFLMKLVVDHVALALGDVDGAPAFGRLALLIGLMGIVMLVGAATRSISAFINEAQGQEVTDFVYDILHAKSLEVDLEYYETSKYYDTLHRAQQEAPHRPASILNGLVTVGRNGISLLAMIGLLLSFHWAVAATLFIATIPGVLVRLRYANKMYRWRRERTPSERTSWYLNSILTGDRHAKEVRLFNLGTLFVRRFHNLRKQIRRERLAIARGRSLAELAAQAGATLAIFGSFGFIAYRTVQGGNTLGDLIMYYQAFQRGQGFLQELLNGLASLYEDNLFLSHLYEFLDLKPKVVEPTHPKPVPCPIQSGIVLNHVSFRYPTGSRMVLEDIHITIQPRQVVALVGENGSGKTTLVKLLCRLYDPTAGAIKIDGIDLRDFETTALRREISAIFQDYARYHLTARENIWLGNVDLSPDDDRVVGAARLSGADDVIRRLPQGYQTTLGKWFEDGEELSIGEWQKVALARAFLRNTQFIVLDEPTSSLDAKTEFEIFKKFRQLIGDRAAILISHRFSTVRMADHIYVMKNGRIVENGSHDELVRRGGMYAHLFEMQAQHYR